MQISTNTSTPTSYSASSSNTQNTDKAFAALLSGNKEGESLLEKITKGGIKSFMEWDVEKIRQRVAEKIMADRGLTAEQIAAMPDKQRTQVETEIMKEVAKIVQDMIEESMRKQGSNMMLSSTEGAGSMLNIVA